MSHRPDFDIVMSYIREQLEAYREDVTTRLQTISSRLSIYGRQGDQIEDRLEGILDVLESTVDVFLRHDAAIEMQMQVTRLWIFLSMLVRSDRGKELEGLKFINDSKDALTERLNELWKSPIDKVVPIRNEFRDHLKKLARESEVFD